MVSLSLRLQEQRHSHMHGAYLVRISLVFTSDNGPIHHEKVCEVCGAQNHEERSGCLHVRRNQTWYAVMLR